MTNNKEGLELYSNELPTLKFEKVRTINDFEIERTCFVASGFSVREAIQGIEYLSRLNKTK